MQRTNCKITEENSTLSVIILYVSGLYMQIKSWKLTEVGGRSNLQIQCIEMHSVFKNKLAERMEYIYVYIYMQRERGAERGEMVCPEGIQPWTMKNRDIF